MIILVLGALGVLSANPLRDLSDHAKRVIFGDDSIGINSSHLLRWGIDTIRTDSIRIVWKDSATVSYELIALNDSVNVEVTQSQKFITGYNPFSLPNSGDGFIVISQTVEWLYGWWEGNSPWLTAKAMYLDKSGHSRVLWTKSEAADEGAKHYDFYETQVYGCCGGWTVNYLYRLSDGARVLVYDDSLLEISADPSGNLASANIRFLGSLGSAYQDKGYPPGKYAMVLAGVSYVSADSILHSFLVCGKDSSAYLSSNACGPGQCFVSLVDTDSLPQQMLHDSATQFLTSGRVPALDPRPRYCLKVKFDCDEPVFYIPLWNDDFLLDKTDFDHYAIVRLR